MNKENKHNKDLGFQVPQDFFKNFEEEMMTQVVLEEKLGKKTGFQVPDGYFESLEDQLLPVMEEPKVVQLPHTNYKRILFPILAIAAVLAVIFTLNFEQETYDLASVQTQELEEYLINNESLYDDSSLETLFADNDILDTMSISSDLDTDELYDYLQEEMELNEIITE
ncbi:MAG: hypothetical protein ACSHWW_08130 [Nonlabens sp.]|uniref:hypothetical protein n=1 Tax=Nonlabens sp. TaxID=1888209 RepID=UPI003EF9CBF1